MLFSASGSAEVFSHTVSPGCHLAVGVVSDLEQPQADVLAHPVLHYLVHAVNPAKN